MNERKLTALGVMMLVMLFVFWLLHEDETINLFGENSDGPQST